MFAVSIDFILTAEELRAKLHLRKNCLLLSKICHHNEKPSATALIAKGQNLVTDDIILTDIFYTKCNNIYLD